MQKLKVMIADDEEIIIDGLKNLYNWEKNGFTIIGEAMNGASAVAVARETAPDVILMDINMPYLSGLDCIREIIKHLPDVALIIISGYSDFSIVREALQLQVTDYLLKPIDFDDLSNSLSKIKIKMLQKSETKASEEVYQERLIDQMMSYIEENLAEDLCLKALSEAFNMNPYYISSYFKKKSGLNFTDYINSRRIIKAKKLIETTDMQIGEISEAIGFRNYRYFSKIFHRYTGKLPSQHKSNTMLKMPLCYNCLETEDSNEVR